MGRKNQYRQWIAENEREMEAEALKYQPLFSVFLFKDGKTEKYKRACRGSIESQIYHNWEIIEIPEKGDESIWQQAKGAFVVFMSENDLLAPNALQEMAGMLNCPEEYDLIYSDEDCISQNGKKRYAPFFKPDWSPDLFWCMNYMNQLAIYRRNVAQEVWKQMEHREYLPEMWYYDFQMHILEHIDTAKIGHISKILYHTRECEEKESSRISEQKLEQCTRIKKEAMARRGIQGHLEPAGKMQATRVVYEISEDPLVSIIIPSKDHIAMLGQCLDSIEANTSYLNYEIVLVDNGSSQENRRQIEAMTAGKDIKYCYQKMKFNFSRMCNLGAENARGAYLLFLNDDIEITQNDWLERLVGQGMQETTGAVGAKLLYPDSNLIQHVGVANLRMGPSHYLIGQPDTENYYFGRNSLDYNCLAVTGACLLVRRDKFYEAGGFDEELSVSFNDIDLCFRLYEAGYYNVVRNDVCLYHHESASRGQDTANRSKMERLIRERKRLWDGHPKFSDSDPFYSDHLVQDKTDFSLHLYGDSLMPGKRIHLPENLDRIPGKLLANIDQIVLDEDIQICGWYYWRGDQWTEWSRVYLLLRDQQGRCLGYSTCAQERKDVAEALQCGTENCGFSCRIPRGELALQGSSYQIGMMVEILGIKRIRWLEEWLEE